LASSSSSVTLSSSSLTALCRREHEQHEKADNRIKELTKMTDPFSVGRLLRFYVLFLSCFFFVFLAVGSAVLTNYTAMAYFVAFSYVHDSGEGLWCSSTGPASFFPWPRGPGPFAALSEIKNPLDIFIYRNLLKSGWLAVISVLWCVASLLTFLVILWKFHVAGSPSSEAYPMKSRAIRQDSRLPRSSRVT